MEIRPDYGSHRIPHKYSPEIQHVIDEEHRKLVQALGDFQKALKEHPEDRKEIIAEYRTMVDGLLGPNGTFQTALIDAGAKGADIADILDNFQNIPGIEELPGIGKDIGDDVGTFTKDLTAWKNAHTGDEQKFAGKILDYINKHPGMTPDDLQAYLEDLFNPQGTTIYAQYPGIQPSSLHADLETIASFLPKYYPIDIPKPPAGPVVNFIKDLKAWEKTHTGAEKNLADYILSHINASMTPEELQKFLSGLFGGKAGGKDIYDQYPGITQADLQAIAAMLPGRTIDILSVVKHFIDGLNAWKNDPRKGSRGVVQGILDSINLGTSPDQIQVALNFLFNAGNIYRFPDVTEADLKAIAALLPGYYISVPHQK
jgi:hypothetical protein